jgi:DNA-binding MarR family transcriptional regulator
LEKNLALILDMTSWYSATTKTIERELSLHGISFSEFLVMYQLSLATNRTMRRIDLAQSVHMSASGVTRLLNPMERLKIIQKEPNPRDARVSLVKLSDVGVDLFNDAFKTLDQISDRLVKPLHSSEIEILLRILKKIK